MPLLNSPAAAVMRRPAALSLSIVVGFLCVSTALDWVSFIEPFATYGITPWNPTAGFSLAFGLLMGRRAIWLLPIAPLCAEIVVRQMPAPFHVLVVLSLAIGSVYSAAVLLLTSPRLRFDPALQRLGDVGLLIGVATVGACIVSCLYVGTLVAAGLIGSENFLAAALRYWIGDVIGILVATPLMLGIASTRWPLRADPEVIAQVGLVAFAFYVIFAADGPRTELFYLLFLPIIWMALRGGLLLVSFGLAAAQILLVLWVQILAGEQLRFTSLQAMMLVLALTGLAIGIVVDERRRAELRLRALQDTQAQLTRLGSFNELSAALAHEINQPLSAATTYARIAVEAMQAGGSPEAGAREAAQKSMEQVQRAAEVVRRIRQLMRSGRSEPGRAAVSALIRDAIELSGVDRSAARISITVDVIPPGLQVTADALQIQQVLINLLRNATEAIAEAGHETGHVLVRVAPREPGVVEFLVEDTGPGFRPEQLEQPFEPFTTTKVDGLGIGLSLCRTIVQANRGRLAIANTRRGAAVRFTLPEALEVGGEKEDLRRSH